MLYAVLGKPIYAYGLGKTTKHKNCIFCHTEADNFDSGVKATGVSNAQMGYFDTSRCTADSYPLGIK